MPNKNEVGPLDKDSPEQRAVSSSLPLRSGGEDGLLHPNFDAPGPTKNLENVYPRFIQEAPLPPSSGNEELPIRPDFD